MLIFNKDYALNTDPQWPTEDTVSDTSTTVEREHEQKRQAMVAAAQRMGGVSAQ